MRSGIWRGPRRKPGSQSQKRSVNRTAVINFLSLESGLDRLPNASVLKCQEVPLHPIVRRPARAHVHAVMALDQAGWHGSKKLTVPNNVSLARLPPYSPELNPAERPRAR